MDESSKQKGLTPDLWFATPIWSRKVVDFERINRDLLVVQQELEASSSSSVQRSNVGGWHSEDQLHQLPPFQEIAQIIGSTCAACAVHMAFDFTKYELVIKEMWLNKNDLGDFNRNHLHPNSILSGTYYIATPASCGNIELYDPVAARMMSLYPMGGDPASNRHTVVYPADAGSLLIFPSWLQHAVPPNRSNESRVSLSFNFS